MSGWYLKGIKWNELKTEIISEVKIPKKKGRDYKESISNDFDELHSVPIDDDEEHTHSEDCPCNPSVEVAYQFGMMKFYQHHSFDGREGLEWANRILKGEKE